MTSNDRLSLALKLRELNALSTQLMESLIDAERPLALLSDVNALHDVADALLTRVVEMARTPSELPFVGANVKVDDEIAPGSDADKANQRLSDGWAAIEKGAA